MSLSPYQIVITPVITEKATSLQPIGKYAFRVHPRANKIEIRKAVQEIFKVKVRDVNTMKVRGKFKRQRFREGLTSSWKKAIVTLEKGQKIEFV